MSNIHIILQGKGGVGKSVIASLVAQFKMEQGHTPVCIDTDPVNATFEGYKKLNVKRLNIMSEDEINTRKFDELIELIAQSGENDVIIDNGASSFVPLSHYLISNQVPALLKEMGHTLTIHTVIAGSQSTLDTVNGFAQLAKQFPEEAQFIVWINPYWGDIEVDGKKFEQMKAYTSNKDRVTAIIKMPKLKAETYGNDLKDILEARMTFNEALANDDLSIMSRQRLKLAKQQFFEAIDNAVVV